MPDIALLPELSVFFGVTIDELFDLTDQKHFERIENMMDNKEKLEPQEFEYARNFLESKLAMKEELDSTLTMISRLYNHRASEYRKLAEYYAKESLEINPTKKDNHCNLREAQQGTMADWNFANHSKRIEYYYEFVEKNPKYNRGYLWLLDELLEDGRLSEAAQVLERLKKVDDSCRVPHYEAMLRWKQGNQEEAKKIWEQMEKTYANDWLAQLELADSMVRIEEYDKAVQFYQKAYEAQPSPKYIDAHISIAQIYELQDKYKEAIGAWKDVIETLRVEWKIREGQMVDRANREIERLGKKI